MLLQFSLAGYAIYEYDTLYTSNGAPVQTMKLLSGQDYSESRKDEIAADVLSNYPNVVILEEATLAYNCHGYAWSMTEGGDTCWINATIIDENDNISKFWDNGNFIQVEYNQAEKIFYPYGDHSAVKYTSTKCISKWGSGPLVKHGLTEGPYLNMTTRRYYVHKDRYVEPAPEVFIGELIPGSDVYPKNVEFEFSQNEFTDDNYTYEWSVTVDGESNVDGNVRLIENQSSATITFLSSGMYTITLLVYNENEQLVGNFTCEAIVQ